MTEFLKLAQYPELLQERPVQMRLLAALRSPDPQVFQAAMAFGLTAPQIATVPVLNRRFNNAFIGPDPEEKRLILELVGSEPRFVDDLRVKSLIAESLRAENDQLASAALELVESHDTLRNEPAIAEGLKAHPEARQSEMKLPDFEMFSRDIEPLLRRAGDDDKACIDCHKSHPIFQLSPLDSAETEEERLLQHYRSALRVITVHQPPESLILIKPTNPAPPEENAVPTPANHGGGTRWLKESASYRTILEWIRSAGI